MENKENQVYTYHFDENTKKFQYKSPAYENPRATLREGHPVYLLPANATFVELTLEEKEGFDIVWNESSEAWEYKEIEKKPEPEEYVPTELDKTREQLWEAEAWLHNHDYIGIKIATGRATVEDYASEIAEMSVYADKVNELKEKIKLLEQAESEPVQETIEEEVVNEPESETESNETIK